MAIFHIVTGKTYQSIGKINHYKSGVLIVRFGDLEIFANGVMFHQNCMKIAINSR